MLIKGSVISASITKWKFCFAISMFENSISRHLRECDADNCTEEEERKMRKENVGQETIERDRKYERERDSSHPPFECVAG